MKRILLAASLLLALPFAHASDPQSTAFTYQGELSSHGQPASGTYDLTFALFDQSSGGNQVGSTVSANQFPVANGLLTIDLDFPGAFVGQQLWLEVTVAGQTLNPRQPVNTVPVAQFALTGTIGPPGPPGPPGTKGDTGDQGPPGTAPAIASAAFNGNGSLTITDSAANMATTPNRAWSAGGNSGTVAGTNFLGTTDANALVLKTGGTAATNERLRMLTTPQVLVNATSAQSGDLFSVYGTGYAGAINSIANQTDYPINAYSAGAFAGIYGENTGTGQGVLGVNSGTGVGLYGQNSASGVGVFGISTTGTGMIGSANSATNAGVRGFNQNTTGTGVLGLGNNVVSPTLLASGSGVAGFGDSVGAYAKATNVASGVGLLSVGNNIASVTTPIPGAGVLGNGENFGVVGYASTSAAALANNKWGGYFDYLPGVNSYAYIAGRSGGVDYGILTAGVKSSMVRGLGGESRVLFATEAPEVLFSDYGTGQLKGGDARVALDPLFTNAIVVNAEHPIKVFVQVEGECNGVYVMDKSASGFEVRELRAGRSNVNFSWQVVASRADTADTDEAVASRFSQVRFPVGPARPAKAPATSVAVPAPEVERPARSAHP